MTFTFNFPNATNQEKWEQIRIWRDLELKNSDWTQLSDAPTDQESWAIYRQALRDLPQQGGKADDVVLPVKPE